MEDLIKQLSSPAMLESYSKIWASLNDVIGLLFNTKITMFNTELTGPVYIQSWLIGIVFDCLLDKRSDEIYHYTSNLF